jgi:glyoxylase-like metal-dependent hydrolase (beta-lactamase superfamily II)
MAVPITIGQATITRIEESYGPTYPPEVLLPDWDPAVVEEWGPERVARCIEPTTNLALVSTHTWIVRTTQSTILVDTCCGNGKVRNVETGHGLATDWMHRLVGAGITPDEVDAVVCTHLHFDHVGWNTSFVDGQWVPTFPNARHYINRTEFEFWNPAVTDQEGLEYNGNVFDDSVAPVFDRDLAVLWDGDACVIDDTLTLELAPGHTPGHCIGWLESGGEYALFAGDSMHSPLQLLHPEWSNIACTDLVASVATRRRLLEESAERAAVLLPAHFPAPHAFRVARAGPSFRFSDAY